MDCFLGICTVSGCCMAAVSAAEAAASAPLAKWLNREPWSPRSRFFFKRPAYAGCNRFSLGWGRDSWGTEVSRRSSAAPRLLRATPGAGNRGSVPFTAGRSAFHPSGAAATPRNGGLPKPPRAGPVFLSLKSGLPRPAHHGACGARMKGRSSAIGRRDSYRQLFALLAEDQPTR
jgi:hypothetical protein